MAWPLSTSANTKCEAIFGRIRKPQKAHILFFDSEETIFKNLPEFSKAILAQFKEKNNITEVTIPQMYPVAVNILKELDRIEATWNDPAIFFKPPDLKVYQKELTSLKRDLNNTISKQIPYVEFLEATGRFVALQTLLLNPTSDSFNYSYGIRHRVQEAILEGFGLLSEEQIDISKKSFLSLVRNVPAKIHFPFLPFFRNYSEGDIAEMVLLGLAPAGISLVNPNYDNINFEKGPNGTPFSLWEHDLKFHSPNVHFFYSLFYLAKSSRYLQNSDSYNLEKGPLKKAVHQEIETEFNNGLEVWRKVYSSYIKRLDEPTPKGLDPELYKLALRFTMFLILHEGGHPRRFFDLREKMDSLGPSLTSGQWTLRISSGYFGAEVRKLSYRQEYFLASIIALEKILKEAYPRDF